jgi:hypothetical protein
MKVINQLLNELYQIEKQRLMSKPQENNELSDDQADFEN